MPSLKKLQLNLRGKPKEPKEGVTAMPDTVRKALGLPSNGEQIAGRFYRKMESQ